MHREYSEIPLQFYAKFHICLITVNIENTLWKSWAFLICNCIMLPIISRERQRIVKRIIVNHIETTKKTSQRFLNHANIKSHDDQSTGNKKQIARKLLEEYLHDSSVHGVKYLGNLRIKSNSLVRFFWALIMILSFVCK